MVTCPSASCSEPSSRHSSVSGLRIAPPNEPECTSPVGPRRSSWPSVMPRMPVHTVGVSRDHMPVSETTTTSQAQPVAPLLQQRGEVRRAGLLLALDDQLEVDGRAGAPGRGEVCSHAERVEEDLALVVGGAARVQPVAVDGGLERRVLPEVERRDRLHVVVAVDERGRRAGVVAGPLGEDGRQAGGLPHLDGGEAGAAQGLREAGRLTGVRRRGGPGRRRSTGCAATRRGPRTSSSAPASTAARTRGGLVACPRCRGSCAEPYDPSQSMPAAGRLASAPMRVATFNLLSGRSVTDGQVRTADLRDAAAALDADVVGLQEVDRAQDRSGGVDQTAVVAEGVGARWRFVPAVDGTPGGVWTASTWDDGTLARRTRGTAWGWSRGCRCCRGGYAGSARRRSAMPLLVPGTRGLTHVPDEPRVALAAVVQGPAGPMTVITAHLSFVPGWNVRAAARDRAVGPRRCRRRGC